MYRLGRVVFSESAAKITALAAAMYAPMIYFEDELLLDFLLVPLILMVLFAAHRARQMPRPRWVFILGLAIGLSAITRPNILICVPVFGWWVWRYCARKGKHPRRFARVIILLAGILIPILPVTLHNVLVGNDLVLIASQGGINFFIGNNAEADGLSAAMPKPWGNTWHLADVHAYAEAKEERKLKPSETSNFWLREGLDWWKSNPGTALKLTFKKAVVLFTNTEVANNQNIQFFWHSYAPLVRFLPLTFGIVAPIGLVGLILAARREPLVRLMLWVGAFYAVSVIAFFVPARFRLPLLPILFIGFGGALALAYSHLRERNWRSVTLPAAAAVLLMALSFGPWYATQPPTDAQTIFQLGNAALRIGDLDQAADYFRQALALRPGYPNAHLNLGVINLRRQLPEPAIQEFETELRFNPQSGGAYANLCSVRLLQGRLAQAEEYGKQAVKLQPNSPTGLISLSKVWWAMRRYREAVELLESAPDVIKDSPVGRDALGGLLVQLGRYGEAERVLVPLADGQVRREQSRFEIDNPGAAEELGFTRLVQHRATACYNLGWMHSRQKDLPKALPRFKQAVELNPQFSEAYANLGAAYNDLRIPDTALMYFQTAARLDSTNAGYVFNLGIARLHLSDTATALQELRRALRMDPNFKPAQQKLALLTRSR